MNVMQAATEIVKRYAREDVAKGERELLVNGHKFVGGDLNDMETIRSLPFICKSCGLRIGWNMNVAEIGECDHPWWDR